MRIPICPICGSNKIRDYAGFETGARQCEDCLNISQIMLEVSSIEEARELRDQIRASRK